MRFCLFCFFSPFLYLTLYTIPLSLSLSSTQHVDPLLRVYASLPTTEEPVAAFVLQDLTDKNRPMLRIERTVSGPGRMSAVGERA